MSYTIIWILFFLSLSTATLTSVTWEQPDQLCFSKFLRQVKDATYKDYKATPVEDAYFFRQIQKHILDMYGGVVEPASIKSYVKDGDYFDCIPFMQQPTIHLLNLTKEEVEMPTNILPLDFPKAKSRAYKIRPIPLFSTPNSTDLYGNKMACDKDTVPQRRLTLERITRYKTLDNFFAKSPATRSNAANPTHNVKRQGPDHQTHVHELGMAQSERVPFRAAQSAINIWNPNGPFSTSQMWLSTYDPWQTIESGWAVGHEDTGPSRFFVFHTRRAYDDGFGCWNDDCEGFVKNPLSPLVLGTTFDGCNSVDNGDQWEIWLSWMLTSGKWCLFVSTETSFHLVGYFPVSLFTVGGGKLGNGATDIHFGGETADAPGAPNIFGPMGSGSFAGSTSWGSAAYQRNIRVSVPTKPWANPILRSCDEAEARCYNEFISLNLDEEGAKEGAFMFFGGPGGRGCKKLTDCQRIGCPSECRLKGECRLHPNCRFGDGSLDCCPWNARVINQECLREREFCKRSGCRDLLCSF